MLLNHITLSFRNTEMLYKFSSIFQCLTDTRVDDLHQDEWVMNVIWNERQMQFGPSRVVTVENVIWNGFSELENTLAKYIGISKVPNLSLY